MRSTLVLAGLSLWVGLTLLFGELRWFGRSPLAERLRLYVLGGMGQPSRAGIFSVESFRDVVGPLARAVGERLSRLLGVGEDVERRLERIHSPLDITAFRIRQVGASLGGFAFGGLASLALQLPVPVALLFTLGGPLLAFLVVEQQLAGASRQWQRRVFLELPVVAEQLAMLLAAGFSLTGALNRLATRGTGACAQDLERVVTRIRQGLSETAALREWAELADVDALDRLVPVLALNRETTDLGRLISEEARSIRRDVQREVVEQVQRREQQVWIPVTVATLVPGVIFLSIPFLEALRLFSQ